MINPIIMYQVSILAIMDIVTNTVTVMTPNNEPATFMDDVV